MKFSKHSKYLSLQVVFNIVWEHFVWNEAPHAHDLKGVPCYVDEGLNQCFVGCVLPISVARRWNHYGNIKNVALRELKEVFELAYIPRSALVELVDLHDEFDNETDGPWFDYCETALTAFAKRWSLTIPHQTMRVPENEPHKFIQRVSSIEFPETFEDLERVKQLTGRSDDFGVSKKIKPS